MGGRVYDYGNPRAWGDNAFWFKIWKPSVVWYGYFLELPNERNKHFLCKFIYFISQGYKQDLSRIHKEHRFTNSIIIRGGK